MSRRRSVIDVKKITAWGESGFPASFLVLQRRIAKYGACSFVFGYERAIAVHSWQVSGPKITLSDKLSL